MRLGDPATCGQRIGLGVPRRRANALNIEVGQALPRCRLRLPEHWSGPGASSLRWLASGGSPLVFGPCTPSDCPSAFAAALSAIEAGIVLHAAHPNFGGTLTVGPYHAKGKPYAVISHGCGHDLDAEFEGAIAAVRFFAFQIGRKGTLAAALAAMEKALPPDPDAQEEGEAEPSDPERLARCPDGCGNECCVPELDPEE